MYTETCHCGHDKSSHYREHGGANPAPGACLVVGGCECKAYVHEGEPKPGAARGTRPAHAAHCRCYGCKKWIEAGGNPSETPLAPHSTDWWDT